MTNITASVQRDIRNVNRILIAESTEVERARAFFGDDSAFYQSLFIQYNADKLYIQNHATPGKDNPDVIRAVLARISAATARNKRINDAAAYEEDCRNRRMARIHPHLKAV